MMTHSALSETQIVSVDLEVFHILHKGVVVARNHELGEILISSIYQMKDFLKKSGIDTSCYGTHSNRASTSAASA